VNLATTLIGRLSQRCLFRAGVVVGTVIASTPGTGRLCAALTAHPIPPRYQHLIGDLT
jgi:hypothetical protein